MPKEDKRFPFMKDFIDEWLKIKQVTLKDSKGYAKVFRKIPLSPMYRNLMKYIDFDKATHACHA